MMVLGLVFTRCVGKLACGGVCESVGFEVCEYLCVGVGPDEGVSLVVPIFMREN